MKIKGILLFTILGIIGINCYSQNDNNKYLLGVSINYSHDDLTNNRLISNYNPYDINNSNTFELNGEFGYGLSPKTFIGIEIGYLSNSSKQERTTNEFVQNSGILNIKSSGISLIPKYKFMTSFSEKILFYTDFKLAFQYLMHENVVSQLNMESMELVYLNMNGNELKYGLAINPGLIFKINNKLGIKMDYSLIEVYNSHIKQTDDNDIAFEDINAWDYNLNMKLSQFNFGIIITW
ncbi:MAG: hypothetical protein GQ564_21780 [Bacteroidales bacterium]|nr:hypothetical protein [Bacteroidales bacterium]